MPGFFMRASPENQSRQKPLTLQIDYDARTLASLSQVNRIGHAAGCV
jgi:hypothetical protein